jgi:hypothetical protein
LEVAISQEELCLDVNEAGTISPTAIFFGNDAENRDAAIFPAGNFSLPDADLVVDVAIGGFGSGAGYPAPDDDGDWGPIGPVVHGALLRLADTFAERLHHQLPEMVAMQGGGGAQLGADDDALCPPYVRKLVKTPDEVYGFVLREAAHDVLAYIQKPGGTSLSVDHLKAYIEAKLVEWFRDPDPHPWIDWRAVVDHAIGGFGGDAGYPAPDDDGDWGPIGPVVHIERLVAGDANGDVRFDQQDIVKVLQGGKYMTGEQANWTEGDFNHDGRFDQLDIVTALSTGEYLKGSYAREAAAVDAILAGVGR